MQCPSCEFQNMPGVAACGRCGMSLGLATAAIDVQPPRASPWAKRLRRWLPSARAAAGVRQAAREVREARERSRVTLPDRGTLARLVVPGWAQMARGERLAGRLFLGAWLGLLVLALAALGSGLSGLLFGLAFAVHAAADLQVLFQDAPGLPERVASAIFVFLLLGLGLYAPALWLVSRVADPLAVDFTQGPFREGDVVLCNRWAYRGRAPRAGDVVLFEFHGGYTGAFQGQPGVRLEAGPTIDRVLAGPGARVLADRGQLWVDGALSEDRPLNPQWAIMRLDLTVPGDSCLIVPSLLMVRGANPQIDPRLWQQVAVVPVSRVEGQVGLRIKPVTRIGWVR